MFDHKIIFKKFKRRVIAGIATLIPIIITFYILKLILGYIIGIFSQTDKIPILNIFFEYHHISNITWIITLFSIILTILMLYLIGLFSTSILVKKIIIYGETFLLRIPLVKSIYSASKQFMEMFVANVPNDKSSMKKVVLVSYPRKETKVIGYITGTSRTQNSDKLHYNVFVPTTPNPTSGILLVYAEDEIEFVDVSIEEAVKFIASAGIVVPEKLIYKEVLLEENKA